MRVLSLLLACGLIPLTASAHLPEPMVYPVFQFPAELVPEMDGDLSDWASVPSEYSFDFTYHEELTAGLGSNHDIADLHIKRVAVGWCDALNRLYFMAEVHDDVHRFHKVDPDFLDSYESRLHGARVHGADMWEIVIDADHAGDNVIGFDDSDEVEMRHRSAYTQNYHLYIPPVNGYYWQWLWGKATWIRAPEYSGVGCSYAGDNLSSGTVAYECYLTPFDDLHPDGPEHSTVHDLAENAVIGMSWAFLDADDNDTQTDAFWAFSSHVRMYGYGEYLVDFQLMPVDPEAIPSAVDARSWGEVKRDPH